MESIKRLVRELTFFFTMMAFILLLVFAPGAPT
jgi:hypothetical protein